MDEKRSEIKYLSGISSPKDLKEIPESELDALSAEIREELVRVVSRNGGHLASNLGVVELTVAIHRVFDTPHDHVIFDVGHQSYVHKMLTGRYGQIDTIRQAGGITGFTRREESEHDCFGAGHSSTSLSAALGFAISDKLSGSDAYTVAVVGDGAFTGGMIHEALNNCRKDLRLIIILNENEMSISRNIGRFATTLAKLRASSGYLKTKRLTGRFLNKIPFVGKYLFNAFKAAKMLVKNAFYGSNYFESMGLTYLGPIDGNDCNATVKMLKEAKKLDESVIIHVKTQKGKGYGPAESNPSDFHGMSPEGSGGDRETFSEIMGELLVELGRERKDICAITAAMSSGTGLDGWRDAYPERFFDVGIAEEHALTFAAGLAANGMRPCAAIYSTFLQRGYDNIIHDIALQKLPVVMAIDRAGLNAKDGATHHGIFDVAFLSHIPNVRIYTPITAEGLRASMRAAFAANEPCAVRYPSGSEDRDTVARFYASGDYESIGAKADFEVSTELDAVIVTHGRIVKEAMAAADILAEGGVKVGIVLLEMLKPYGETADRIFDLLPEKLGGVLFLEEEIRAGGMGACLSDVMRDRLAERGTPYRILATDDSFVATVLEGQSIYEAAGVDRLSVVKEIRNMLK